MNIDYSEIDKLPDPPGCVDEGALYRMWDVYMFLWHKYLALVHEPYERYPFPGAHDHAVKWARYWAWEVRMILCRRRRAARYNLVMRVRSWVLRSKTRRLAMRKLIGEDRITKWQARAEELEAEAGNSVGWISRRRNPPQHQKAETERQYGVKDWYRLPLVRKLKTKQTDRPAPTPQVREHGLDGDHDHDHEQGPVGMGRAVPQIVFWPHELVEDYINDDEAMGDFSGNKTNTYLDLQSLRIKLYGSPFATSLPQQTSTRDPPEDQ